MEIRGRNDYTRIYASDFDIRTFCVDNKIFAVQKNSLNYDFRSNTHRGVESEAYILSKEEKELVLKALRVSRAIWLVLIT